MPFLLHLERDCCGCCDVLLAAANGPFSAPHRLAQADSRLATRAMWGQGGMDWSGGCGGCGKGGYGKAPAASPAAAGPYGTKELKPGDWICETCGDHQLPGNKLERATC